MAIMNAIFSFILNNFQQETKRREILRCGRDPQALARLGLLLDTEADPDAELNEDDASKILIQVSVVQIQSLSCLSFIYVWCFYS
jgi:hypothetical protein